MRKLLAVAFVIALGGIALSSSSLWFGLEQNYQGESSISLGGLLKLDPYSLRMDLWQGSDACTLGLSMGLCTFKQGLVEARTGWAVSLEQSGDVSLLAGPFAWIDFIFGKHGWVELEGNLWLYFAECCPDCCLWGYDVKALGWLSPCPEVLRGDFFMMQKLRPNFCYQEGRIEGKINSSSLTCCLPKEPFFWIVIGYKVAIFDSPKWRQVWRGPLWGIMVKRAGWEVSLGCHQLTSFSRNGPQYDPRFLISASINF